VWRYVRVHSWIQPCDHGLKHLHVAWPSSWVKTQMITFFLIVWFCRSSWQIITKFQWAFLSAQVHVLEEGSRQYDHAAGPREEQDLKARDSRSRHLGSCRFHAVSAFKGVLEHPSEPNGDKWECSSSLRSPSLPMNFRFMNSILRRKKLIILASFFAAIKSTFDEQQNTPRTKGMC
jgi:hypothetical protein